MDAAYWIRQTLLPSAGVSTPKRQRTEADAATGAIIPGQEAQFFVPQDDHARVQSLKDTMTLGASYDRYLQNAQPLPSYGPAQAVPVGASLPPPHGGNAPPPYQDPVMFGMANNSTASAMAYHSQAPVDGLGRPMFPEREAPLPPDASTTLYLEGLPRDATEREVAHIFRPFLGYKEVRLVKKEPKFDGGSPVLLCFVDFTTPSYAMAAMNAVEGYTMDLNDRDASILHVEFAKFPARRPTLGFRGKRDRY